MSVVKCPQCNLVNFSGAVTCKRCNYSLEENVSSVNQSAPPVQSPPNYSPPTPLPVWNPPNQYQPEYQAASRPNYQQNSSQSKKLAIISMVFGILSFPFFNFILGGILAVILGNIIGAFGAIVGFFIPILFLPTGLISGIVALVRANKHPNEFGGKGFAVAGIILSSFAILVIPFFAAIAIPNISGARKSANEGSAISSLQIIVGAEATYNASAGAGSYGDLGELGRANLIDPVLATGTKNGYVFVVTKFPNGYEISAVPISAIGTNATGTRSFYYSSGDRVLRVANKKGLPADKNDSPLESSGSPPQIASQK